MDPYKVLGVTPQTSDDDVKRAYRELARKYHPDNYVNNPLADLAEARMKEINEAYDTIMSERSGKTGAGAGSYLNDSSYHLRTNQDLFLYSNVTKTRIQQESSNSGGGGSSVHTSSSGSTHGGGGGKF